MIAIDTNILVYAFRREYPDHERARSALQGLLDAGQRFALAWPCVHEFVANVSNRRIYQQPDTVSAALDFIQALSSAAHFEFIAEGSDHLSLLSELSSRANVTGGLVHDARIAAICLAHGVAELWSADRDFLRFPQLRVRNPLVHD